MASSIATPLERQFSTIAGINQMTSSSTMGGTNITLQFDLTRSLDAAAQDVQSKIAAAQAQLPRDMPSPPSYQKVNPADKANLYGSREAFTVQANGQLLDAAAYAPLIVTYRNGSPVRLDEIGRAIDSVQNDKVSGWVKGQRAIVLAIQRQPGTNTVEVVDNIK